MTEWDGLVERADGSTFCHLAGWGEILTDVLGHEWVPLSVRAPDGQLSGVLPLVRLRSRLLGDRLVSMPFLNYGGPVGAADARRRLVRAAVAEAHRSDAAWLEIRAREAIDCGLSPGRSKVTVLLELPVDLETLWQEFRSTVRNRIRRARKEGMEVRVGADQLEPFYDVFARNMRDLGTPVLPRVFFERVASRFAGLVDFTAIWWRDRPVAGSCGFVWRDEFEITWVSSLREHNVRAPNMLLYWSLMERMSRRGVRLFNFGRCTPGGGTHRFKRNWGGADVPLQWKQWAGRAGAGSASYDAPGYRAAAAVWRRLPVPVTRRLGPLLARQLP